MFENWWATYLMLDARERDIRTRIEQAKSRAREDRERRAFGRLRKGLGSLLLAWGAALAGREA